MGSLLNTEQIIASSSEVTRNSSYCWEYTKIGLKSGFGIIVICPVKQMLSSNLWGFLWLACEQLQQESDLVKESFCSESLGCF